MGLTQGIEPGVNQGCEISTTMYLDANSMPGVASRSPIMEPNASTTEEVQWKDYIPVGSGRLSNIAEEDGEETEDGRRPSLVMPPSPHVIRREALIHIPQEHKPIGSRLSRIKATLKRPRSVKTKRKSTSTQEDTEGRQKRLRQSESKSAHKKRQPKSHYEGPENLGLDYPTTAVAHDLTAKLRRVTPQLERYPTSGDSSTSSPTPRDYVPLSSTRNLRKSARTIQPTTLLLH